MWCASAARTATRSSRRLLSSRARTSVSTCSLPTTARTEALPRRIETHFIPGPAGRLEALLEEPVNGLPREACLVCHPHPLYGGTMHNKAVYRVARGLRRSGSVVLRFNFRGVNLSEGTHDNGYGEVDDAR